MFKPCLSIGPGHCIVRDDAAFKPTSPQVLEASQCLKPAKPLLTFAQTQSAAPLDSRPHGMLRQRSKALGFSEHRMVCTNPLFRPSSQALRAEEWDTTSASSPRQHISASRSRASDHFPRPAWPFLGFECNWLGNSCRTLLLVTGIYSKGMVSAGTRAQDGIVCNGIQAGRPMKELCKH